MVKVCVCCGSDYEIDGIKNKRGRCTGCINKSNRFKYAQKRVGTGEGYKDFEELFKRGFKKCTKCFEIKHLEHFSKGKSKSGLRVKCKSCDSLLNKEYENKNREKINENRRLRRKNPTTAIILSIRSRQQSFFKKGRRYKAKATTAILRDWLGCSIEECKNHIEFLFEMGMDWNNRGIGVDKWQIDHKIPVSLTQFETGSMVDNEFNRRIWHYKNLQPLWHSENATKSDSLIHLNEI